MSEDADDEPILTVEEFRSNWITPSEALRGFSELDRSAAVALLRRRLGAGVLRCAAEAIVTSERGNEIDRVGLHGVPNGVWDSATAEPDGSFWVDGDHIFYEGGQGGYGLTMGKLWQFFGIRFDPEQLGVMAGFRPPSVPEANLAPGAQQTSRGGRPTKGHWEALLVAVLKMLHEGDLQPQRQADVERAMHEWLTGNDHSAGETQVRLRAKRSGTRSSLKVGN